MRLSMFVVAWALVLLAGAGIILYVLYRVIEAIRQIKADVRMIVERELPDLFHQIQALGPLHAMLDLPQGLPPLRKWAGSPDFLLVLARHVKRTTPRVIVECGSGASTLVLARMLQRNGSGHLYSLEHSAAYADATRTKLREYGLEQWATITHAPLVDKWYALPSALPEKIDMLVIDGPPTETGPLARHPAGPRLLTRLSPGGSAFLDDALRDDEREVARRWRDEFPGLRVVEHPCEKGCAEFTAP
jgi:predicted O-methyltransferase YrrM